MCRKRSEPMWEIDGITIICSPVIYPVQQPWNVEVVKSWLKTIEDHMRGNDRSPFGQSDADPDFEGSNGMVEREHMDGAFKWLSTSALFCRRHRKSRGYRGKES